MAMALPFMQKAMVIKIIFPHLEINFEGCLSSTSLPPSPRISEQNIKILVNKLSVHSSDNPSTSLPAYMLTNIPYTNTCS